jgi:hypothetical protein
MQGSTSLARIVHRRQLGKKAFSPFATSLVIWVQIDVFGVDMTTGALLKLLLSFNFVRERKCFL